MKTLIALGLLLSLNAIAGSHKVLTVTSDNDADTTTLTIITDGSENLTGLQVTTLGPSNLLVKDNTITLAQARTSGATLFKSGSYEVIKLIPTDRFEPQYGGPITLNYLSNGITGSRKNIPVEVVREGNRWVVRKGGATVSRARVTVNKVMGRAVGVKQITF